MSWLLTHPPTNQPRRGPRRAERIEREIEEREAREELEVADAPADLDALQRRQIFDSRAAFRRLANELEEVGGTLGVCGVGG